MDAHLEFIKGLPVLVALSQPPDLACLTHRLGALLTRSDAFSRARKGTMLAADDTDELYHPPVSAGRAGDGLEGARRMLNQRLHIPARFLALHFFERNQ